MSSKPWQGQSVVIVDDSPMVRDTLRGVFESMGMQVKGVAQNGSVGLELVQKHRPDLVSLDVIMPEMDGVECYKKLKAGNPDQKVVMISWLGAEQKILDNLKDIIPGHIFTPKPATVDELEIRLAKIYGLVPVALPVAAPEADVPISDLKTLSARVS